MTLRSKRDGEHVVAARELTLQGLDSLQHNDWVTAEQRFREAVMASPHDEQAHRQYAKTLWHRQAIPEAVQHMHEAVRLSGGAPELLVELGEMHLALGQVEIAERIAAEAVTADLRLASAHALLGDIRHRQQRLDEALHAYHWALDLEPNQPRVQIAVAEIYQRLERPRRVLASLQALQPAELEASDAERLLLLRGLAQKELGRQRDAIESFAELHLRRPGDASVLYHLADAHWRAGEITAAWQLAEDALQHDPQFVDARRLLSLIQQNHPQLASQARYDLR